MEKLLKMSDTDWLLVRVRLLVGLVVPTTCAPNVIALPGKRVTGGTPVPESEDNCGLPGASSEIVSVPVRAPSAVGTKETTMVQTPPAASGVTQLLFCVKSPLVAILAMFKAVF